jgi:hypothetical protein
MDEKLIGYKIKLSVAVEKNGVFDASNELLLPCIYPSEHMAKADIERDKKDRLMETYYFRTNRAGYDLVRYNHEHTCNTYLCYALIPWKERNVSRVAQVVGKETIGKQSLPK